MCRVWVNSKWLTSDNLKLEKKKDKPSPLKRKVLWGLCPCAEPIYEGDSVGMRGDHEAVVCYVCWVEGKLQDSHLDCAGLKLPEATLSN